MFDRGPVSQDRRKWGRGNDKINENLTANYQCERIWEGAGVQVTMAESGISALHYGLFPSSMCPGVFASVLFVLEANSGALQCWVLDLVLSIWDGRNEEISPW
jgi:hypothetical protein